LHYKFGEINQDLADHFFSVLTKMSQRNALKEAGMTDMAKSLSKYCATPYVEIDALFDRILRDDKKRKNLGGRLSNHIIYEFTIRCWNSILKGESLQQFRGKGVIPDIETDISGFELDEAAVLAFATHTGLDLAADGYLLCLIAFESVNMLKWAV